MFFHFFPLKTPIKTAKLADNNNAIWFGPANDSSPYMYTLYESKKIKKRIGDNASKKGISEFDLMTKLFN